MGRRSLKAGPDWGGAPSVVRCRPDTRAAPAGLGSITGRLGVDDDRRAGNRANCAGCLRRKNASAIRRSMTLRVGIPGRDIRIPAPAPDRANGATWHPTHRRGHPDLPLPAPVWGRGLRRSSGRHQPWLASTTQNRFPSGSASTTKSGSTGYESHGTRVAPSPTRRSISAACSAASSTTRSR